MSEHNRQQGNWPRSPMGVNSKVYRIPRRELIIFWQQQCRWPRPSDSTRALMAWWPLTSGSWPLRCQNFAKNPRYFIPHRPAQPANWARQQAEESQGWTKIYFFLWGWWVSQLPSGQHGPMRGLYSYSQPIRRLMSLETVPNGHKIVFLFGPCRALLERKCGRSFLFSTSFRTALLKPDALHKRTKARDKSKDVARFASSQPLLRLIMRN